MATQLKPEPISKPRTVGTNNLPLRDAPSFSSTIHRLMPRGLAVEVISGTVWKEDQLWVEVRAGDHTGWCIANGVVAQK